MQRRKTDRHLSLGQQLREARLRAQLKPKDVARKAKLSVAAAYNAERLDRGGRTKTLMRLGGALGLTLRVPDFRAICSERELKVTKLAAISGLAFATVRSILTRPDGGNVGSLERLARALGERLSLVV